MFLAFAGSIAGCASPGETALGTQVPLSRASDVNGAPTPATIIWRSPDLAAHERDSNTYLVLPVTVYRGKGSDFAHLSAAQVDTVASDINLQVRSELGRHFRIAEAPGPHVLALQLIMVSVEPPRRIQLRNGPYDWSAAAVGMPDAARVAAGTMTLSGKFTDAETGELLVSFVAPVSPPEFLDVSNPSNAEGEGRFAQAASRLFATELVADIVRQREIRERRP